jgi:serine/threonine protein kinase/Flp pilus assembly protein TadD
VIGETISHYKILSRLGAGGMGVVYEAEDTRLGRKVAIKFLPDEANTDAEAVERFQREARVVSNLNHPHICTLFDIGSYQRLAAEAPAKAAGFMVMELLDGQSLKDRIARSALTADEAVELGSQLADALDAAHAQGVIHRDIKPANLFVTRRGDIKVLDFGVAKLGLSRGARPADSTRGATDQLTTMGTTIGTVSYMSPEQARGQEIDARSDLFSAGVVLYEMATGQLPFQGSTVATIFEGLLTKPATPPSQIKSSIPAELDRIILKSLEKNRDERYQTAADLRADLKRLRRDTGRIVPQGAQPVSPKPANLLAGWRRRIVVGAPLVTILLVGAFILYRQISAPALTEKDAVVLASVVNRTGDTMFDDTLGEALALQLRQSPFLSVVPDQQVQATLRLMGREPMTPITAEIGRELCQRAGARALLGGAIAMLGSSYVITLNAQDCVDGDVLAEAQAQAGSKEDVLNALGAAVSNFREKLGESLPSIRRYDARIEEATTRSLEALKAYSQGIRTRRASGNFDSVPFFRRAIELDPEFALAYARLGTVYGNIGQSDEARKMTAKAYELRQRVSEAERLYIEARYYSIVEPDTQKALDVYRVWLGAYPNDYTALTNSALLLKQRGDSAAALANQEAAVRVAPGEPLAWGNLSSTYMEMGRYDDARRTLESALALQDASSFHANLFVIGVLTGDRALADAQVAATEGKRDDVDMLTVRIVAAAYQGRMKEAASVLELWTARMDAASRRPNTGEGIANLAINEAIVGLTDTAKARMEAAIDDERAGEGQLVERLVIAAIDGDAATARQIITATIQEQRRSNTDGDVAERAMRALLSIAEGKPAAAVPLLEPLAFESRNYEIVLIWSMAHVLSGQWEPAVKGLNYLVAERSQRGFNAMKPYGMAMLGRAHAELGRPAAARKAYEAFFDLWKDADPDVPLLVRAREEYKKLGS